MDRRRHRQRLGLAIAVTVGGLSISACGPSEQGSDRPADSAPAVSAPATPTSAEPLELIGGGASLGPGTYSTGYKPAFTFEIGADWVGGTVSDGFIDIQQDRGSPDVVAVQFARVDEVVGADGQAFAPTSATEALDAIVANPGVSVVERTTTTIDGRSVPTIIIDNEGSANAPVMRVAPGMLGFDPGRRLSIALLDTEVGVVAFLVGGSVTAWERAIDLGGQVLDTVLLDDRAAIVR